MPLAFHHDQWHYLVSNSVHLFGLFMHTHLMGSLGCVYISSLFFFQFLKLKDFHCSIFNFTKSFLFLFISLLNFTSVFFFNFYFYTLWLSELSFKFRFRSSSTVLVFLLYSYIVFLIFSMSLFSSLTIVKTVVLDFCLIVFPLVLSQRLVQLGTFSLIE